MPLTIYCLTLYVHLLIKMFNMLKMLDNNLLHMLYPEVDSNEVDVLRYTTYSVTEYTRCTLSGKLDVTQISNRHIHMALLVRYFV